MPATIQGVHLGPGDHASRPAANAAGQPVGALYSCTDHSLIYKTDGSSWATYATLGTGSGISATLLDAAGDIIYASAADTAARLAAGSSGTYLRSAGVAAPVWSAAPASASYKRTTGNYTTSSATFVDMDGTNLALTITTLARRVLVGFSGTIFHSAGNNTALTVDLDGTNLGAAVGNAGFGGLVEVRSTTNNHSRNASFTFLTDVLSAGSHTFKLQWTTASATATAMGGGTDSSYLQFYVIEQMA